MGGISYDDVITTIEGSKCVKCGKVYHEGCDTDEGFMCEECCLKWQAKE